jgi:WD40-like Beta Propeller Repeat
MRALAKATFALVAVLAVLACPAQASFPGHNGKLLLKRSESNCLWTVGADGSGLAATPVCGPGGFGAYDARFSPDGTRVVYDDACVSGTWTSKLDGTETSNVESGYPCEIGQAWSPDGSRFVISSQFSDSGADYTRLFIFSGTYQFLIDRTCPPDSGCFFLQSPDWSPDGTTILYSGNGIERIPASGGAPETVTATGAHPSWSPDGFRIAFSRGDDIWTMDRDGSNQVNVTNSAAHDSTPVWSPDGRKIAFTSTPDGSAANNAVWTMNVDGTGATQVTAGTLGDWQPIPFTGYARPKGATPVSTYLTVAYRPCAAPTTTHGSPLAFPSCSPPVQASDHLTVGTGDANGLPAATTGRVRYEALPGDPSTPASEADAKITVSVTGVLTKPALTPYTGELSADAALRLTDRDNSPAPAGTVEDSSFPVTVPCSGGECAVTTTANTVVPGAVVEGKRAIWELGQVSLYDGGADGVASTTADNTLFMDEGIFVP